MTKFKTVIAIAVGSLFAGAAFAQSNYSIEQRDRAEQARIDRGVQSGQLTSREADRLQGERAQIERMEDRARADGRFTGNERARIDRAQDRLGRDIYRESHDGQVANSNSRNNGRGGWDGRNGTDQRQFERGNRWDQSSHRDADRGAQNQWRGNGDANRGAQNQWRGNGDATHTGTNTGPGRSDWAPGRQPHVQQTPTQTAHVQQAQAHTYGNGTTAHTGTNAGSGRSNTAPGRQPHLQQAPIQTAHVQQAQSRRTTR